MGRRKRVRAATIEQSLYTLSDSAAEHGNTLVYMETRGRGTAAIVAKIKEGLGESEAPISHHKTHKLCTSSLPPRRALAVIVVKSGKKIV